jgi:hypothetical protein
VTKVLENGRGVRSNPPPKLHGVTTQMIKIRKLTPVLIRKLNGATFALECLIRGRLSTQINVCRLI